MAKPSRPSRRSADRGLAGRPTIDTLVAFAVVFVLQAVAGLLGLGGLFVFRAPIDEGLAALALSVYAHAGVTHLVANAVALVLLGLPVERGTTRLRFHAFFLATGALAAVAEVVVAGLVVARPVGVLGASGAIFALLGYLLGGNPVSGSLLDRLNLSRRAQLLAFGLVAVVVTLSTSAPGVALVAHFTGLLLGLIAGRTRVLRTGRRRNRSYK
ncbi:rhomboid family intramembrane serine protease [Halegenticoccus tardaugens]|uniref:rhomboid family intramembrane serine protease n=1 Tax=Halegenticoccus tardaugens TaxID=2071624 RepID=UPI00100BB709|nr:rhomboid family intramembrane serine protease [Halegenticoccus tardaugens]